MGSRYRHEKVHNRVGTSYGGLTIAKVLDQRDKYGAVAYLCKCDSCGREEVKSLDTLKYGARKKYTGCWNCRYDLTGKVFGIWTVTSVYDTSGKFGLKDKWNCVCRAGHTTVFSGARLKCSGLPYKCGQCNLPDIVPGENLRLEFTVTETRALAGPVVYCFKEDHKDGNNYKYVYIGSSQYGLARPFNVCHKKSRAAILHCTLEVIACRSIDEARELEHLLIKTHKPVMNTYV